MFQSYKIIAAKVLLDRNIFDENHLNYIYDSNGQQPSLKKVIQDKDKKWNKITIKNWSFDKR